MEPVELAPSYRALRHRRQVADSLDLAMKTKAAASLALLIDTAIESQQQAAEAEPMFGAPGWEAAAKP